MIVLTVLITAGAAQATTSPTLTLRPAVFAFDDGGPGPHDVHPAFAKAWRAFTDDVGQVKAKKRKSGGGGSQITMDGDVSPPGTQIGIGGQIGYPTAFVLKVMLMERIGLEVGVGVGVGWWHIGGIISAHVDVVWHPHTLAQGSGYLLSWFVGAGLWLGFDALRFWLPTQTYYGYTYLPFPVFGVSAGVRVPVGLSFMLKDLPLEFYGALVPSVLCFPAVGIGLGGQLGVRFWL